MTAAGSPHSETLGSKPARRLPEAYRCPRRLSSVPSAKASTIRPCKQPHTRGKPARPTNTGRQIINTLRSQNDQTTTRPPTRGDPVEIHQYKQTTTSHPKKGRPRGPLASTLQFSNHHATPHTPTRRQPDRNPWRAPERQPPTRRAVAAREPNSMPIPAPTTGTQRSFHASTPDTPGRKPREPCQALKTFSVERR